MANISNTSLTLEEDVKRIGSRLPSQEYTLCKGLKQPFNNTNSGSRKIMQGIQMEQATQLLNPEVPIISTGYENQFGEYNSNFVVADADFLVLDRIPKFSKNPSIHYWLLVLNLKTNELSAIERTGYKHITEFYGYLYDNEYLDNMEVGKTIKEGDVIKKTISYDEYNNRAEGLNLTTMYIACEDVKEDPIVISESAAKRFSAPLIDRVEIKINDNDILLNLYGKGNEYKTFPDIGEYIQNNILCSVRRELKDEEALFSQSWERLKQIMMNDRTYIVEGRVIDIDVFCNNPEKIESVMYNQQIKQYYDEVMIYANRFVKAVDDITANHAGPIKLDYHLARQYQRAYDIAHGKQFVAEKVFNNIIMHIYVEQEKPLTRGDKITDRYGGKGVISLVRPDNEMPHFLKNGKWTPVDLLYSKCTCINRLNDGQMFETSLTFAGSQLLAYIQQNNLDMDTAFKLIYQYINIFNPDQAQDLLDHYQFTYKNNKHDMSADEEEFERDLYIQQMIHEGYIMLSLEPISSNISIDKVAEIYKVFPFLKKHCPICVPQQDSNGNYRMVIAHRPCVIGHKYIFRLKQFAIEKFSAVSLASTNIRNENSKSRMAKIHNAKFASTPVRVYGEMETSTIGAHVGTDISYEEFMLCSSSPMGRRQHQELLTGDPFKFNIELDENSTSLTADIGQAYMKTLGERLRFIKIKKFKKRPMMIMPLTYTPRKHHTVVYEVPEELRNDKKAASKAAKKFFAEAEKNDKKPVKEVVTILPGVAEETKREIDYKNKLKRLGLLK